MVMDLMTVSEAAEYLRLSVHTLNSRRQKGEPPGFVKYPRGGIRYEREVLDEYIRDSRRYSTKEEL